MCHTGREVENAGGRRDSPNADAQSTKHTGRNIEERARLLDHPGLGRHHQAAAGPPRNPPTYPTHLRHLLAHAPAKGRHARLSTTSCCYRPIKRALTWAGIRCAPASFTSTSVEERQGGGACASAMRARGRTSWKGWGAELCKLAGSGVKGPRLPACSQAVRLLFPVFHPCR